MSRYYDDFSCNYTETSKFDLQLNTSYVIYRNHGSRTKAPVQNPCGQKYIACLSWNPSGCGADWM